MHKYAKNPVLHMCLKTGTNHPKKGIISKKNTHIFNIHQLYQETPIHTTFSIQKS